MRVIYQIAIIVVGIEVSVARGPDTKGFENSVVPFLETYCFDCHDGDVMKGDFSLEAMDANVLGDHFESWRLVEEQLKFGDMPPENKKQPSKDERARVLAWLRSELLKAHNPSASTVEKLMLPEFGNYVAHDALFGKRLDRVYPAPPRIWRLRPQIYDATLPRLGEGTTGLARGGLSQIAGPEFDDFAAPYWIDEASTSPLLGNAKKIAESMTWPKSKHKVLKELVGDSEPEDDKVKSAITFTFQLVLGRQPTEEELPRFFAFYEKAKARAGHVTAAKAMLTAVLMQPEVLFRQELGDGQPDEHNRMRLSKREIAYALSYALDNKPRPEFLSADLKTQSGVAESVSAALQDDSKMLTRNPRVFRFFREYFDYPFADEVFKDKPAGGTHNAILLINDLTLTIRDILKRDENVLAELLTTRDFYVQTKYGSKKEADKFLRSGNREKEDRYYHTAYSLPYDWKWTDQQPLRFREDERAGVLTHPAWLVAWSGNFENHPVQRGKWIRTHLLGGTVADVPIGVDARVPEIEHTSFRNRLKEATNAAECWRCHEKMDPLGLVFERYDHYGRYQRIDATQPVDVQGLIDRTGVAELDGRRVSGPAELMEILAASEYVEQVFVRYAFRFFMGRNETVGDANSLQDAHAAYRESNGSFKALVTSLLSSDSFLYRQTSL